MWQNRGLIGIFFHGARLTQERLSLDTDPKCSLGQEQSDQLGCPLTARSSRAPFHQQALSG